MGYVSNRFSVTAIHDGAALNAVLRTTTTLTQWIDGGGNCLPDWTNAQTQPTLYVVADLSGSQKRASGDWYYNGLKITFNSQTGYSTGNDFTENGQPIFQVTEYNIGTVGTPFYVPALKIIRNLAKKGNTDNDIISYEGSVEDNGYPLAFTVSLPIRIQSMTGTGFYGVISGAQEITTASPTTTLTAELYNNTDAVQTFWVKWIDEATGTTLPGHSSKEASSQGKATVSIGLSDVTDYLVLRCDFYDKNDAETPVTSAFYEVDDMTDDERMYIANSSSGNQGTANKSGVFLRSGENVTFTAWMGKNTSSTTIDTRYLYFYCKLYDNKNNVITANAGPSANKGVVQSGANKGLFDITKSVTVPGVQNQATGGEVVIDFDYLDNASYGGGLLSGIIIASTTPIETPAPPSPSE